jgi:sorting nexin-1/2
MDDDNPFQDSAPAATATVTVDVDVEEAYTTADTDVNVEEVTTSMQTSRVSEPVRTPVAVSAASGNVPFFEINIAEYTKKGDGMNAHVVYTIVTKTSSTAYKSPNMTVQRRFNHFLWLYEQLTTAYPGVIVPPVPEKQAMGRFDADFLILRKVGLERCLRRIAAHPLLHQSSDLRLFLEEENLDAAMNKKIDIKKSLLSGLNVMMNSAQQTFNKHAEKDEYFDAKRAQLEIFERQLKMLLSATETMVKNRKDLAAALGDFGVSVKSLGTTDSNKPLASALSALGEVQEKLKDIHSSQAERDELDFLAAVDEYVRLIGSIKVAMTNRQKLEATKDAAAMSVIKKRDALEKARGQPSKAGKISGMEQEVEDAEASERKLTQDFDDCSALLKEEFARFDEEKVKDFQASAASLVESMLESQKKIIDVWTAYLPEVQSLPSEGAAA